MREIDLLSRENWLYVHSIRLFSFIKRGRVHMRMIQPKFLHFCPLSFYWVSLSLSPSLSPPDLVIRKGVQYKYIRNSSICATCLPVIQIIKALQKVLCNFSKTYTTFCFLKLTLQCQVFKGLLWFIHIFYYTHNLLKKFNFNSSVY